MSSLIASAVSVETEEVSEADDKTAKITIRRGKDINIPTMPEGELANGDNGPTPV